jgi:hypothetical protein
LLYDHQGQYAKAESLFQWALAIMEKALGPEHPDVVTCLENYVSFLRAQDRSEEALPIECRGGQFRKGHLTRTPI